MADIRPDIIATKDDALSRLKSLHDDFKQTALLWQEVLVRHRYGMPELVFKNVKTGSETEKIQQWTQQARESLSKLRVRTFKDLSNEVEQFIDKLLRIWLTRFPKIIQGKSITLEAILTGTDLNDLKARATTEAVEDTILQKLKDRPWNWFKYLDNHCGVIVLAADRDHFIERKAARDALEHHDGEVDQSYLTKAGTAALYKAGELIEPDDEAIDTLYDLVFRLIERIAADAVNHFPLAESKF